MRLTLSPPGVSFCMYGPLPYVFCGVLPATCKCVPACVRVDVRAYARAPMRVDVRKFVYTHTHAQALRVGAWDRGVFAAPVESE